MWVLLNWMEIIAKGACFGQQSSFNLPFLAPEEGAGYAQTLFSLLGALCVHDVYQPQSLFHNIWEEVQAVSSTAHIPFPQLSSSSVDRRSPLTLVKAI